MSVDPERAARRASTLRGSALPECRALDRRRFLLAVAGLGWSAACRSADALRSEPQPGAAGAGELGPPGGAPTELEPAPRGAPLSSALELAPPARGGMLLPTPDFSEAAVLRRVAGIRPYRRGGPRVERERFGQKWLVHDYGHGGGGITLSWGCAHEALDLLAEVCPPSERVAVLGAGVSGLSCALLAARRGHEVSLYARDFPPDTTSDIAGGQWSPSLVGARWTDDYRRILRRSHAAFAELVGRGWGVDLVPNYATRGAGSTLRSLPRELVPYEELERLPFAGPDRAGGVYQTFMIETPFYLQRLLRELQAAGVDLERREFGSSAELAGLEQGAIINTLGLGAGRLFGDARVLPVRGQLVHLRPLGVRYMLSASGYLFARGDAVILGGTVERGVEQATPVAADCERILAGHRRFFEPGVGAAQSPPR